MKILAELTTLDWLYYFLKQSIRTLQQIHATGTSHRGIDPFTLCIESPYSIHEGSLDITYAAPEIALSIGISEKYTPEEAVRRWKQESKSMQWIERWLPGVAEQYSRSSLQKLIGIPIPESQSDIWSLGISYLCTLDALYKETEPFSEKQLFLEAISSMLHLRGRSLPRLSMAVQPAAASTSSNPEGSAAAAAVSVADEAAAAVSVVRPSARMTLAEPIRRGERNKTRKNPYS
jgi:serine/threonine protein kinase